MAYRNRTVPDSIKGMRRFVYNVSRGVAADPELYGLDEDWGRVATYFAAWVTNAGEQSAWGPAQSMTIGFSGPAILNQKNNAGSKMKIEMAA